MAAALVLASSLGVEAGTLRLVVVDLPYARVWTAALAAVESYPLERASDGVIVTERIERPPRANEGSFQRIAERVTLRVRAFGTLSTRVSVEVESWGLRQGAWVPIGDTAETERLVLDRVRAALG